MTETPFARTRPRRVRPHIHARVPETAMILAAGLGTRMRPLTDDRPKALVEVAGRTLIDRILDHLQRAGVRRAVVNCHAERLIAHLDARTSGPEILISDERDRLLNTGGGLRAALSLLGDMPFYAINCDALWTDGLSDSLVQMAGVWDTRRMDGLLLTIPSFRAIGYAGRGDFEMDGMGRLDWPEASRVVPHVYAGLQILAPDAVAAIDARIFPLRRIWDRAIDKGRLFGMVHDGEWVHVGTPDAVALAERTLDGLGNADAS